MMGVRKSMKKLLLILALLSQAIPAVAAIHTEKVAYKHGDVALEGYLAYEDATEDKRPGVLVFHEWMGLGPYAERRARELAELGYIAFAADMYGRDVRPKTHDEAGRIAGIYKNDRALMRSRAQAALDVLKNHPLVDPERLAAIGYCFGGTTALELARSGADLKGVAAFHASLSTPHLADAKNIKAKIRVFHGGIDPFVTRGEVDVFKNEMQSADVDWRMLEYDDAVHSFTVPEAGGDPQSGAAYNKAADENSWRELKTFLSEIFK